MTPPEAADTRHSHVDIDADHAYATAVSVSGLWKSAREDFIHLFDGDVIESDAPGSGHSDDPDIEPFFPLDSDTVIRKTLSLDDATAVSATIAFIAREAADHAATLLFTVNGHEVRRPPSRLAAPEARQYQELGWSRWYYVPCPSGVLQAGDNTITVAAVDGLPGWELMIADYRDFHKGAEDPLVLPRSSHLSTDGGQTWSPERGDYVIRLALQRYRPAGSLVSPVLDVAQPEETPVQSVCRVHRIGMLWDARVPRHTHLRLMARTSASPAGESWSAWQPCEPGVPLDAVQGRYLQWRADLGTSDRTVSPALLSVRIDTEMTAHQVPAVRVVAAQNPLIQRSSYSMPAEEPGCPLLNELRERCELDAVIAGAQTEFDAIQRLHRWAYHIPLRKCTHFPWNPLAWLELTREADGSFRQNRYDRRRRDTMCLYPNVVLVAALQSCGLPARHVNFHSEGMSGHEVAEVWCNDYGKWIHLDATRDYYWYDPRTGVPLDTGEIHQVLVSRLQQVERWDRPYLYRQDLDALVADLPIAFWEGDYKHSVAEGALYLFRSMCHFRIVPRFDVFSRPRPLPVSQGTEVWSWNGYLNWADDMVPPLPHFSCHTNRRADFYPTLNQTRYTVTATTDPHMLHVQLETVTPDFATYEARLDGAGWHDVEKGFDWELHRGLNVLETRTRNGFGWTGCISALSVMAP